MFFENCKSLFEKFLVAITLAITNMKNINIIAISGSLRPNSSNSTIINIIAGMAPSEVNIVTYGGLADLPHFNPELDSVIKRVCGQAHSAYHRIEPGAACTCIAVTDIGCHLRKSIARRNAAYPVYTE